MKQTVKPVIWIVILLIGFAIIAGLGAYIYSVRGQFTALASEGMEHKSRDSNGDALAQEAQPKNTEQIYQEGIRLYHAGDYSQAIQKFNAVRPYGDSRQYLALMEARNTLWLDPEKTLKQLLERFDFEDTASVVLCNHKIAVAFLEGNWQGEGRYLTVEPDGELQYNLPWVEHGDRYRFEDGKMLVYPEGQQSDTRPMWTITAKSPDCIEVFCHYNQKTFTLYRQ